MPRRYVSSKQRNQEAALSLSAALPEQSAAASKDRSTAIRPLHVLILGGMSALAPLSTDMYLPALPALSRDLGASMAQTQVTLSAGILGLALGQVIAGPSSDALGRRRPLLIGMAAYVLASLLCLVAPSVAALSALRFVQGVAGAAGIAIALAIVSDLYSGVTQARFFALLMQVSGLAPIIAPIIGSQLLRFTSWRGVFVTLALIGVALLLAAALGLGETLPPSRRQSGGSAASVRAFRDLLSDRRFVGYAVSSGFAFAAGIVYISVSPFILQNIYGASAQLIGILFGINALGLVIMAQVSGRLVGRVSSQALMAWGVAATALGGASLLVVVLTGIGLAGVLPSLFIIVASLGLVAPNATALALADTPTAGSASALLGVLQFSIGAVTAPLVGIGGATTAVPMAAFIAAFGIATLVTFVVFCQRRSQPNE
ncbi:MAG TPA: multidrug effflux MFS transporter [Roseiflexaceae bacterium]|nr:multidrug effflux MFS transporter [Roseiflexaceae bacterium]